MTLFVIAIIVGITAFIVGINYARRMDKQAMDQYHHSDERHKENTND